MHPFGGMVKFQFHKKGRCVVTNDRDVTSTLAPLRMCIEKLVLKQWQRKLIECSNIPFSMQEGAEPRGRGGT